MRRIGAMLSVLAVLLLLDAPAVSAAGGGAPPPPGSVIANPAIQAIILIDTHTSGDTPTAGTATVYLRQGTITTQSSFQVVPAAQAQWLHGCDTNYTIARFVWSPSANLQLSDWVPLFFLDSLFTLFGIIPGPTVSPVITQIRNGNGNGQCLFSPDVPLGGATDLRGYLLMDATIQFLVPGK